TVQRSTDTLSGGERARLALAMLMLAHANLILLDEPTNHLDVESIEALEDAISAYDGTIILVSHDRALLRSLATRVWSLEDRRISDFDGGFADWEQWATERDRTAARAKIESTRPTRAERAEAAEREHRRVEARTGRAARRALEAAEADVMRIDARVASLTARLEDPALYDSPTGMERARELSAELDSAKRELDAAVGKWEEIANDD
ncbi:MAG TPA: ATP-binding cassette domain-containing protein, partial [Gemmatimonadaceae bacterium]|nr:ATP-binding cassette domain-containing protein [Gemmatimonadaceae bacterium]